MRQFISIRRNIDHLPRFKALFASDDVTEGDYFIVPPIQTAAYIASFPNFIISRKGYGSMSFKRSS
jgi:hypothetical protein